MPELHYNHAAMEQYYFRFIRYTSQNFKQVVFLIYENSIEVNLLKMILAKEKINLFMKNQLIENGELYEKLGDSGREGILEEAEKENKQR